MNELNKTGNFHRQIELKPLDIEDIALLVRDVISDSEQVASEIAEVLLDRTQGNPFFIRELINTFYERRLVFLKEGKWKVDISGIRSSEISANAAGLMVEKIAGMPDETVSFLKYAACIGDSFQKQIIYMLTDSSEENIDRILTEAANEGFFIISGDSVQFSHDKIREAAYSLISDTDRSYIHYKIGNIYYNIYNENELSENVFIIVNQLNKGLENIRDDAERQRILELNLFAGRKLLSSPAFESACIFFKIAESLLPEDFWSLHYADALDFYSDKAHAEYLSKDFGSAESTLDLIFQNAKTVLDRIIVYELRAAIYTSWNRIKESIEFLTEALNSLGMSIPENPSELSTLYEIIVNKIRMRNKSIHSLV
ncbi:MAG TPA: hypothetical protein PL169_28580, partial [Leptospiraceae bacterium]|nr:hypothetical protein [Leptospiraceae bacterium]